MIDQTTALYSNSPLSDMGHLRGMVGNQQLTEKQKMAEVSRQFEAVMLRQILSDAMKPMVDGYLDESGGQHEIYRSFMTEIVADSISKSGTFGLANSLQAQVNQFMDKQTSTPTTTHEKGI